MTKESEIHGIWWFPDNAAKRWIGRLTLAKKRSPHLHFVVPNNEDFEAPPYPLALLGEDKQGKAISLLRLGRDSMSSAFKLSEVSYKAGHAFVGLHVQDIADLQINNADVYIQQLVGWLRRTGFDGSVINSSHNEGNIRYRRPQDLRFNVREDLSIEIVSRFTSWDRDREQGVRENNYIYLDAPKGVGFQQVHDLISSLAEVLHFASLEPIHPIRVIGTSISEKEDTRPKRFEWFSAWMRDYAKSDIDPNRWIFQFADVQTDFGTFLAHWLDKSSKYKEALSSYATTVYLPLPHSGRAPLFDASA